jgi:hypothetical protein
MERQMAARQSVVQLAVRPHFWRQLRVVLPLAVYLAVFVVILLEGHTDPDTGWGIVAGFLLIGGLFVFETVWQKIIVTSVEVRMKTVRRVPSIPRAQVGHIRALVCNTVFYDHDGKRILETRVDLSRTQLVALGNELGVNVWDHRAWHGLKKLPDGVRLNPEPLPHRPSA